VCVQSFVCFVCFPSAHGDSVSAGAQFACFVTLLGRPLFAQRPRAPWISMPPLVREVRLSESMDLLTGFSRLLRWRNLSKDPSILFVELRGPAAAWSWVCDSGAPPSHHPKGEILLEVSRFVNLLLKFSEIFVCLFGLFVCLFGLFGTATCALPHKGFNRRFSA
jgi:hypothetical protein